MNVFREALSPFRARMPHETREIEVLRISGNLDSNGLSARRTVLQWMQKKAGKNFPTDAWDGSDFELLNGGRHAFATSLKTDSLDLWAVRSDDPDKEVAGRIWTTEVTIGGAIGTNPFLTVRQLMTTNEEDYQVEAAVPSFFHEILRSNKITVNKRLVSTIPELVASQEQMDDIADWLVDPSRRTPVYLLTIPDDAKDCLIDSRGLARSVAGLAHIVVVPQEFTWMLTERFERKRAVFGGGVRAYLTGFTEDSDPFAHRLIVADRLQEPEQKSQCLRWMRNLAALESRKYSRLGQEVLPYTQIKSSAVSLRLETIEAKGGNSVEQISALKEKIKALENDIIRVEQESSYFVEEHSKAEERAESAEAESRSLAYQVRTLQERLASRVDNDAASLTFPIEWASVPQWCEDNFSGLLVLTPNSRKGIKKADFEDVKLVARCLAWLIEKARPSLLGKSQLILRDCPLEGGIINAPCGSDSFEFQWNGRRLTADWHVKTGGNTREPRRCLRIYYAWDHDTQQIIIADMPAHRTTEAS